MKGESPQRLDTELYEEPTKKTHGARVPSGRLVDFGSTPGKALRGAPALGDFGWGGG